MTHRDQADLVRRVECVLGTLIDAVGCGSRRRSRTCSLRYRRGHRRRRRTIRKATRSWFNYAGAGRDPALHANSADVGSTSAHQQDPPVLLHGAALLSRLGDRPRVVDGLATPFERFPSRPGRRPANELRPHVHHDRLTGRPGHALSPYLSRLCMRKRRCPAIVRLGNNDGWRSTPPVER